MQKYNPLNYIVLIMFVLIEVVVAILFIPAFLYYRISLKEVCKEFGVEALEFYKDFTSLHYYILDTLLGILMTGMKLKILLSKENIYLEKESY